MTRPTAFFIRDPYSIADLRRPHSLPDRKPYAITAYVTLKAIDYENFTEGMTVWRQFIEGNISRMYVDAADIWHCVLIQRKGQADGVLVMSQGEGYPKWAAYFEAAI